MLKKLFGFGKAKNEGKEIEKKPTIEEQAILIMEALGGQGNILKVDACMTRLRIRVVDKEKIHQRSIIELGALEVLEVGDELQAVFATASNQLKVEILKHFNVDKEQEKLDEKQSPNKLNFVMPLDGTIIKLADVPDGVFASKMMGDGFAIDPTYGEVVSPVNGKVMNVFATKHAIGLLSDLNMEILIHVGIDTVSLKGEGFELLVDEGEEIKAGQPLLKVDLEKIKKAGKSIITPIIFTNLFDGQEILIQEGNEVKRGEADQLIIK
ncbi:PTS sugar transporter subunit IIA [Alkaliphilus transvaalensis]|uniref:PTS sugar transporter subunit IIA n=1 Tax=Alkaliphilus transvaalensis TaxID=114628 RepID=UPI000A7A9777|nr:PTS glucose transporter subunit IIA [Alkaliphilus transvaalensis]